MKNLIFYARLISRQEYPGEFGGTATAAQAEAPISPQALKFDIERYVVEGNTVLKPAAITKILAPYTGTQKDLADVQRALEALQFEYQKAGWGVVTGDLNACDYADHHDVRRNLHAWRQPHRNG
jgi:hypothetical protein